MNISSFL